VASLEIARATAKLVLVSGFAHGTRVFGAGDKRPDRLHGRATNPAVVSISPRD
jgi:hypothetical protein